MLTCDYKTKRRSSCLFRVIQGIIEFLCGCHHHSDGFQTFYDVIVIKTNWKEERTVVCTRTEFGTILLSSVACYLSHAGSYFACYNILWTALQISREARRFKREEGTKKQCISTNWYFSFYRYCCIKPQVLQLTLICWQTLKSSLYTQLETEVYKSIPCVCAECLLEEETSVAAARKMSTLLRKCSVRERAGINPVFCAVSTEILKVICFFFFFFFCPATPLIHKKYQKGMKRIWHWQREVKWASTGFHSDIWGLIWIQWKRDKALVFLIRQRKRQTVFQHRPVFILTC